MRSKGRKESLSDSRDLDGSYDQLTEVTCSEPSPSPVLPMLTQTNFPWSPPSLLASPPSYELGALPAARLGMVCVQGVCYQASHLCLQLTGANEYPWQLLLGQERLADDVTGICQPWHDSREPIDVLAKVVLG
ncbi:hypothetical protein BTVI_134218 [Pitangus sulphuratus]|nr:hypothetical protein BTVI_134218 [Pitangus sulphuratus]